MLNAIAANGATLMVAVLAALGLSANATTATARIPSLIGYGVAAARLMRAKVVPWGLAITLSIPTVAGGAVGAVLADLSPETLTRVGSLVALVLAAAILMLQRSRWNAAASGAMRHALHPATIAAMFVVGLWGGFIVVASGVWVLMALVLVVSLAGAEGNAVKALAVAGEGIIATAIVLAGGHIRWDWVLPLSVGAAIGALIGAKVVLRDKDGHIVYWTLLGVTVLAALETAMRLLP